MKLTFLGGADEVGASSTLIEVGGRRLLVDAGIRISSRPQRDLSADQLPDLRPISEGEGVDVILVTHAHTDHTGALPLVVERYPGVPVYATEPTLDLTRVLQADAQRIMQNKQEEEGELPLFDELAVDRLLAAMQPVEFRKPFPLGEGLRVTYHPAGHIVGAASLLIDSDEGRLIMSGDVSLTPQRAVISADPPNAKTDFLVLESTYGGKLHANRQAEEKRLIEMLRRVIERGGKALIPAFALGRAQEVLQILLAYADELDAPIYADGMVRAVCRAYNRFADLLPKQTVKAAKDDALFFRGPVRAMQSQTQRIDVAYSAGPCVIVASSGMLTGGPAAFLATALAGDERNAILLTGYQDEEAPGKVLQKIAREKKPGEAVPFRIAEQTVSLRCELDTYSLSAHADEAELVSFAESFSAPQVALVHGDPTARESLAGRLRDRNRRVLLPISGQSYEFTTTRRFRRPRTAAGSATIEALDVAALWEQVKEDAGGFLSAAELSRLWAGDEARAPEVAATLIADGVYFAQDWRHTQQFQVRTPEKIALVKRRRALMAAYPSLNKKLVVLRDRRGQARLAIVTRTGMETFETIALGTKTRHHPAESLVWVLADWDEQTEPPLDKLGAVRSRLTALDRRAQTLRDTLIPAEKRRQLAAAAQPIDPSTLVPAELPPDVSPLQALITITLALAKDGAIWQDGRLVPAQAVPAEEPLEMNQARQITLSLFPPESRLRKVGLDIAQRRLTLTFDFPDAAAERYADQIEQAASATGWEVTVTPGVNQQALSSALLELLPSEAQIIKSPSYFLARRAVQVKIRNLADPDKLVADYQALTGFALELGDGVGKGSGAASETSDGDSARPKMEINAAFNRIRKQLEPYGLYRVSLKDGRIIAAFISPQVGTRYSETLTKLAWDTGYEIVVYPHPNQQAILQEVERALHEAGLALRKSPGLRVESGQVVVKLVGEPDPTLIEHTAERIQEKTGYTLVTES